MKKILTILIVLSLFGFPFVLGQDLINIPITAGEVSAISGETFESLPSDFGALILNFNKKVSKILSFMNINLHKTESIESVVNYEVLALPIGTGEFIGIIPGDVFAESESVILEGKTETNHSWVTNSIQVKVEGNDFLVEPNAIVEMGDDTIQFTNWIGADATYVLNNDGIDLFSEKKSCESDPACPSEESVSTAFPGTSFVGFNYVLVPELNNQLFVVLKMTADDYTGLLIDGDRDGEWNFFEFIDGYSVNSFESYTLLLGSEGIFDLYVITPDSLGGSGTI